MKLTYQDYGSSILLFINASNDKDAYGKYLSLWNWNCTSSEADFVDTGVIAVWSTVEKLKKYLFDMRVLSLADSAPLKGVKGGCAPQAKLLAEQDFAEITHEPYRSMNSSFFEFSMGLIEAEKPDDDFRDLAFKSAFSNKE